MSGPLELRLGTRASLLALAQSRLVAASLVERNPSLRIKLVEFATRGDRDQQTPLADINDNDFFSDALDRALLDGTVDFCVHSRKDIDGPRPAKLIRAATPAREQPHDAVLFRADIMDVLKGDRALRIGTSSLRRHHNVADMLSWALPASPARDNIEFANLRGPVQERLQRITASASSARLDGVVLAVAGLQRLWQDAAGRAAIEPLLRQARWMLLPLSAAPTAPGQGALAVECRAQDSRTRGLLRSIHDPLTEELVGREHALAAQYFGANAAGCGVTAAASSEFGYIARLRGRSASGGAHELTHTGIERAQPGTGCRPWLADKAGGKSVPLAVDLRLPAGAALFLAHSDALPAHGLNSATRCWTSGPASWKRLADRGVWVEGCTDNLGFAALRSLLDTSVLQLPELSAWTAFTHADATDGWTDSGVGHVTATYRIERAVPDESVQRALAECTHFYWSSARQYRQLEALLPPHAQHACGIGKTLAALRAAGLSNVQPFTSRQEWQAWLG